MKHRLAALAFASAVVTAAPLAFADALPPDASATGGSGGTAPSTGGNAATGGGGSGSTESGGGCTAAPGNAGSSAAIVLGLGLLCAIPLVRRRSSAK